MPPQPFARSVVAKTTKTSATGALEMKVLLPFSTKLVAAASGGGGQRERIGSAAWLGHPLHADHGAVAHAGEPAGLLVVGPEAGDRGGR